MMNSTNNNDDDTTDANAKILEDLQTVSNKINLCKSLFSHHTSSSDERLVTAIEFLQLCGPRMIELIEAGAQGFLSETTVVKCLEVNDDLCKTLNDYQDMDKKLSQPVSAMSDFTIDDDLKDLIMDSPGVVKSQEGKTAGLENDSNPNTAKPNDDFDSFFDQRFNAKQH